MQPLAPAEATTVPATQATDQRWGAYPRKAHCVHDELLADGSMILYNACRQQVITLNPTAALIWDCCDGAHRLADLVDEVCQVFPQAPEPQRDVLALLRQLHEGGMLAEATG